MRMDKTIEEYNAMDERKVSLQTKEDSVLRGKNYENFTRIVNSAKEKNVGIEITNFENSVDQWKNCTAEKIK